LANLQKLRIMWGNDMYPSIDPKEHLYLDTKAKPEVGDVVLFENRYGIRIPHRLIFEFLGYYFTKGDNCRMFNFPVRRDKVIGVIAGKRVPVARNPFGDVLLALFLPYFEAYSRRYGLMNKKYFLLLDFASRCYPRFCDAPKREEVPHPAATR